MANSKMERNNAGFTLIELLIVVSLISLLSTFIFITTKDELHNIRMNAMVREFQTIANIKGMDKYYSVSLEEDEGDFSIARGDIGFTVGGSSDDRFFTLQAKIPSLNDMIQPYGIKVESVKDGDDVVTHTLMTFYSKQEDPLASLYLSDPYSSKITSN